jgi:ABC-type tungstate transport system substrate-binding protein
MIVGEDVFLDGLLLGAAIMGLPIIVAFLMGWL